MHPANRPDNAPVAGRATPGQHWVGEVTHWARTLLLERMEDLVETPRRILDLGSGAGQMTEALRRRFPDAVLVQLDRSALRPCWPPAGAAPFGLSWIHSGLWRGKRAASTTDVMRVQADVMAPPFSDASFDLVVADLLWPHLLQPEVALGAVRPLLRAEGTFFMSTLGAGSLRSLAAAFQLGGWPGPAIASFADVMTLGDALLAAGFREAVLDVERRQWSGLAWPQLRAAGRELQAGQALLERPRGLLTPRRLRQVWAQWRGEVEIELLLVHGRGVSAMAEVGLSQGLDAVREVRVPLERVQRKP